jgi:hypothetical protein
MSFHEKKVDKLIKNNQQITHRETADKLGISQKHVGHIIYVLQCWKFCARQTTHMLTAEMKAVRVPISQQLLSHYENKDEICLHNIRAADEMWVHHYKPKTQHQSMEYHHKDSPAKKNSKPRLGQEKSWLQFFGTELVLFTWTSLKMGPSSTQSATMEQL